MANNARDPEVNLAAPIRRITTDDHSTRKGTCNPNDLAIQQMHALEPLGWNGGDHFYDGPHDNFCFVCGSTMELVGCQTCENCYHAGCMSPSLDPDDIPSFWFCPHCVERDWHVPPSTPEVHFFAPLPTSLPVYPSPNSPAIAQARSSNIIIPRGPPPTQFPNELQETPGAVQERPNSHGVSVAEQPATKIRGPSNLVKARLVHQEPPEPNLPGQTKRGRERHSSLPRKKSKYSAFSSEVDKALTVLYSELETAAQYGKSEGSLQGKIQALEQKLKVQEGQMLLTTRELESIRKDLGKERSESAMLKVENLEIRMEIARLKESVEKKDYELNDWRTKLRSMIGSELE